MELFTPLLLLSLCAASPQEARDVPVTIKELDVQGAIREFQTFQEQLERYRLDVATSQKEAVEIAQIVADLQGTATPENNYNEGAILEAIASYVENVVGKQVGLVDFLESQRYRISYYANQMATSVNPQDVALLFGTEANNNKAIELRVQEMSHAQQELADFLDALPAGQFDKRSFRSLSAMTQENQQRLNELQLRYQNQRGGLDLAKSRLALVRQAERLAREPGAGRTDLNVDLLLGQMFGTLDRIRLQMSSDLLNLEAFMGRFAQASQTQEVFKAFQNLLEAQGGLDAPSPGLASMLDWLQDSSSRHLSLGAEGLQKASHGQALTRSSDLLREAYEAARGQNP